MQGKTPMNLLVGVALLLILNGPISVIHAADTRPQSSEVSALDEIESLSTRLEAMRAEIESEVRNSTEDVVDLSGEEVGTVEEGVEASVLAKPWHQNIDVTGMGAMWFADYGSDGTRPDPGFVIKESSLFIEVQAWEDVSFFLEVQTTSLQRDD